MVILPFHGYCRTALVALSRVMEYDGRFSGDGQYTSDHFKHHALYVLGAVEALEESELDQCMLVSGNSNFISVHGVFRILTASSIIYFLCLICLF